MIKQVVIVQGANNQKTITLPLLLVTDLGIEKGDKIQLLYLSEGEWKLKKVKDE